MVEVTDVADIADIAVEIGRQNMAGHGRIWQIAVRLPHIAIRLPSHGRSLVELVETGGRV